MPTLALASLVSAADFARFTDHVLWLDNGAVRRAVAISPQGQVSTRSFRLPDYAGNFLAIEGEEPAGAGQPAPATAGRVIHGPDPAEFSFVADGTTYSGKDAWEVIGVTPFAEGEGSGATLALHSTKGPARLRVELDYVLYPGLPLVRKRLRLANEGTAPVRIESVDVEVLNASWNFIHSPVFFNNGRYRHLGPYEGDAFDSVVVKHDERSHCGFVLGNEAPGVLKRTAVYSPDWAAFSMGLTHADQRFPFRKWLPAGGRWDSPWTFIAPFHDADPASPLSTTVATYTRKFLGARVTQMPDLPVFIYNTWIPFHSHLDEKLVLELADAAAACGAEAFVVDDGWQDKLGDWNADRTKFPHGLKPVFEHVKALGLKKGLWFSFTTVRRDSAVFTAHPEWWLRGPDGEPLDLQTPGKMEFATACLASAGWREYIKGVILGMVRECGLDYVKLDFSMVTSAYRFDPAFTGCYATNHGHRDRPESFLEIYRGAWQLFDEIHAAAPGVFVDCTFEAMGGMQLSDLDLVKHAAGNSVANFSTDAPTGVIRLRQLGWWRTPTIPATALEIGNHEVDSPGALLSFQSLVGTLPLMCGDPRKLAPAQRAEMKRWAQWLRAAQDRHQFLQFRQDLPGFGEPAAGRWDGFQRINDETKSGGIVGVFRAGATERERRITVAGLAPAARYRVHRAPEGTVTATLSGAELARDGFPVALEREHAGALFEISRE
ncbi:MAG TPA: alpha-galactosidase [Lacunisphaera sp.]|nr:alpha-galactosidase [Lacunisphaera sp.]